MTPPRRPRPSQTLAACAALLLLALTLAGCGSSSEESTSATAESPATHARSRVVPTPLPTAALDDLAPAAAPAAAHDSTAGGATQGDVGNATGTVTAAAVISTGNVDLRADDVATARFDVQKVTDTYAGQVADEDTRTSKDGTESSSRMVLRIPSAKFGAAMDDLSKIEHLESSSETSKDVTTQVIDNKVRIGVERASIDRIQQLLARARTIRDIITIESQLSSRQADLNSLERQQAYLADQTSLSTITVDIERTPPAAPHHTVTAAHHGGFVGGLRSGWHGLRHVAHTLATAAGVLLPWAVVALVLAVPGVPLVRRIRRRRTTSIDPAADPA